MSDRLSDPGFQEVFACELAKVEKLGTNRRLIFTVPSVDGADYHNIVAKLIVSADYLPAMIQRLAASAWPDRREGVSPELLELEIGTPN